MCSTACELGALYTARRACQSMYNAVRSEERGYVYLHGESMRWTITPWLTDWLSLACSLSLSLSLCAGRNVADYELRGWEAAPRARTSALRMDAGACALVPTPREKERERGRRSMRCRRDGERGWLKRVKAGRGEKREREGMQVRGIHASGARQRWEREKEKNEERERDGQGSK